MKTEHLIAALVADRPTAGGSIVSRMLLALVVGGLLSLCLFFATLGVRQDFVTALSTWRFDLKLVLALLALVVAFGFCRALAHPIMPPHPGRRLLPLLILAAAAVATELVAVPPALWGTRLLGSNALICLIAIPVLSLAPLAAILAALRKAAPASAVLAGEIGRAHV